MGITSAALHLPARRLPDKELAHLPQAHGQEALRVPWWDEDPLTLALEAGLHLDAALDGVEQVHLALDEATGQPGLVHLVLGLDEAAVTEVTGPDAGLEALITADPAVPALVLAGGARLGGAGVALLLEPGKGVAVTEHATTAGCGLAANPAGALTAALGELDAAGPVCMPPGRLGRKARAPEALHGALSGTVGDAGAAGALVDLVHHLAHEDGPRRVASVSRGHALAASLGPGRVEVAGLRAPAVDVPLDAWQRLQEHQPVPWHEASQGAYVSAAEYEADPLERYGARHVGTGTVEAVTTVQAGPPGEFQAQHEAGGPYDVAIVALDRGGRTVGQAATPPGQLGIGTRVRPVLRRLFRQEGRWRYGLKWQEG